MNNQSTKSRNPRIHRIIRRHLQLGPTIVTLCAIVAIIIIAVLGIIYGIVSIYTIDEENKRAAFFIAWTSCGLILCTVLIFIAIQFFKSYRTSKILLEDYEPLATASTAEITQKIQDIQSQLAEYQDTLADLQQRRNFTEQEFQHKLSKFDAQIAALQHSCNIDQLQSDLHLYQKILRTLNQT